MPNHTSQTPAAPSETTADPDPPEGLTSPSTSDLKQSVRRQARLTEIMDRLHFGRSRGLKSLAAQDLEKRRQAEERTPKEAEARERKEQQEAARRLREENKRKSKERAEQHREDKKRQKTIENHVQKIYIGGMSRGYHPSAGTLRPRPDSKLATGSHTSIDRTPYIDEPLNAKPCSATTWGVEYGKPRNHFGNGHFSGHHDQCGDHSGGGDGGGE